MARYASGSEASASGRKERASMTGAINRLIGYAFGLIAMYIIMRVTGRPERNRGEWTNDNSCQFCGFQPWFERDIHTLSFCPNCGADMRKRGE